LCDLSNMQRLLGRIWRGFCLVTRDELRDVDERVRDLSAKLEELRAQVVRLEAEVERAGPEVRIHRGEPPRR
jgi:hypothetical protein